MAEGTSKLEARVVRAAEAALAEKNDVSPIDVLVGVGWLSPPAVQRWRQGRVEDLERVAQANLLKLSDAMRILRGWATAKGLRASETAYVARTRDRRRLRFTRSGTSAITTLFPGCPPERAESIARHARTRSSGRVGRSAAGRALDPNAVTFAVVASVRHLDTPYDRLLMSATPRQEARDAVREKVAAVIDGWRSQASAEVRAES